MNAALRRPYELKGKPRHEDRAYSQTVGGAAFRPGRENWPLLADARQTGTVTTGHAPMSALEPTPVANPRTWALPPVAKQRSVTTSSLEGLGDPTRWPLAGHVAEYPLGYPAEILAWNI